MYSEARGSVVPVTRGGERRDSRQPLVGLRRPTLRRPIIVEEQRVKSYGDPLVKEQRLYSCGDQHYGDPLVEEQRVQSRGDPLVKEQQLYS